MAEVISNPADFYDSGEDEFDIDNAIYCPKCGFGPCEIVMLPSLADPAEAVRNADEWWGWQEGKAKCEFCGITFPIQAATDDGEAPR